ncbi:hypothetical protein YC2023_122863 [Brassica napus]
MANSRFFFSDLKSGKCSSVVEARLLWFRFWGDQKLYFNNLASSLPSPFSYRVEMAIADDTAAGTFVWFDGVMKKLHNLRASEAVQMLVKYTSAEDGVNSEDSRRLGYLRSFQIWKESQYTFQVRVTAYNLPGNHKTIVDELGRVRDDDVGDNGGNEDDDDNMPNGKPAPVGFASGRATGNGSDGSIRYCA